MRTQMGLTRFKFYFYKYTRVNLLFCPMRTQSKIYPGVFLFQVNILLLDNNFFFITDYMTVVETVGVVAK